MRHFITVNDIENLHGLIEEIKGLKADPHKKRQSRKSVGLFFFNPSLRTRLSTQRAAQKLGMDVISNNMTDGWPLEFQHGAVMDTNKSEHVLEAAQVIAQYFDIIGIRAFPSLKNLDTDYSNPILNTFKNLVRKPIINLESGSAHPCQGLTDVFTIEEHKTVERPKVVLSWAPHPKALPHSVANSFLRFANAMDYDLHVVNPEGYDLPVAKQLIVKQHRSQQEAFRAAHFIYTKNWSSTSPYGQIKETSKEWMVNSKKLQLTENAKFMHCLPVRRNVIVADEVLDSNHSIVIEQAQNRMWSAMAVLQKLATVD